MLLYVPIWCPGEAKERPKVSKLATYRADPSELRVCAAGVAPVGHTRSLRTLRSPDTKISSSSPWAVNAPDEQRVVKEVKPREVSAVPCSWTSKTCPCLERSVPVRTMKALFSETHPKATESTFPENQRASHPLRQGNHTQLKRA